MAIYSCNLASVGRTTHAAGTAGAHLRYIARPEAEPVLDAHIMPRDPVEARTWMDRQEAGDRKNARVLDKIRIALPRELSKTQRLQLARAFCEELTGNRVPWMLAIHQEGKDAHNPHAHIVVRDRDVTSGRRALRLSDSARERQAAGLEPKAVEWIRQRWEHCANAALAQAGREQRVDRRTLEAQGIEREPTIHLGPRGQFVDGQVQRPRSRKRKNGLGREIDYPTIDQGRTRKERHAEIIDLNLERAARSPDGETRAWAAFEKIQRAADRRLEKELADLARRRTQQERRVLAGFRTKREALKAEHRQAVAEARAAHRAHVLPQQFALRVRQAEERAALRIQQSGLWSRIARAVDITGGVRRRQESARGALVAVHRAQRTDLALVSMHTLRLARAELEDRYRAPRHELEVARGSAVLQLREMRQRVDAMMDARRQLREAARERDRLALQNSLQISRSGKSAEINREKPRPGRAR